jgi:hypothetical protein
MLPDCGYQRDHPTDGSSGAHVVGETTSIGSWGSITGILMLALPVLALVAVIFGYRRWRRQSTNGAYGLTGTQDDTFGGSDTHNTNGRSNSHGGNGDDHVSINASSSSVANGYVAATTPNASLAYARVRGLATASSIHDEPSNDQNFSIEMTPDDEADHQHHQHQPVAADHRAMLDARAQAAQVGAHLQRNHILPPPTVTAVPVAVSSLIGQ